MAPFSVWTGTATPSSSAPGSHVNARKRGQRPVAGSIASGAAMMTSNQLVWLGTSFRPARSRPRQETTMTTVQINLPDELAEEAARAGLLASERMESLLREQLRAERLSDLRSARNRLATPNRCHQ